MFKSILIHFLIQKTIIIPTSSKLLSLTSVKQQKWPDEPNKVRRIGFFRRKSPSVPLLLLFFALST